ncbi:MAG TPA: DHA2 family efflux MFS transporter permease subunit [Solirubrobacteraceae bacterium]|nr:DHA2 family efflux MFS transporter permease subunit [Solirubrobacteraceae bacterium]
MSPRILALLAICGGVFLAFLDTTIVNTSFPDIRRGFEDASPAELSWILDGYFIVLAALLVPAGGLADRLGRRRVFLGGVALFVVTSLLCAVAPTWQLLVVARVLQGVGAAIAVPASLALLLPLFPPERRAAGVGIWGAAAALAAAIGPPLGGVLVEVADWRWIFLVNLPLGALVLLAGVRGLQESRDPAATGLPDLLGSALAAASLGLLALGLVQGNAWGWGSAGTLGSFAGAAVLLAAVVARCVSHPRPIVDLALLRIPSFRHGTLGTLLFAAAFFSMILGNILFLTGVWGYSVLDAGLAVAPGPLASAIVAGPAGGLADRFGHRAVIVPGALVYAAGLVVLRSAGLEPDYLGTWLPGQVLVGIGIGLAFPTLGAAAAADIPPERFGVASAVTGAGRQLGAVLGTALLIAIVGEPETVVAAADVADDAYVFGIGAALLSGAVALRLAPRASAPAASSPSLPGTVAGPAAAPAAAPPPSA